MISNDNTFCFLEVTEFQNPDTANALGEMSTPFVTETLNES